MVWWAWCSWTTKHSIRSPRSTSRKSPSPLRSMFTCVPTLWSMHRTGSRSPAPMSGLSMRASPLHAMITRSRALRRRAPGLTTARCTSPAARSTTSAPWWPPEVPWNWWAWISVCSERSRSTASPRMSSVRTCRWPASSPNRTCRCVARSSPPVMSRSPRALKA